MIRQTTYRAGDFDDHGLLKAPWLFWCGALLQARAWWMTGLGMASEHGGQWLSLVYPDTSLQITGLAVGVPALVMLFCYPLRGSLPWLARGAYLLMLAALAIMMIGDISILVDTRQPVTVAGGLVVCADLACLVSLWPDRRLRGVFSGRIKAQEEGCHENREQRAGRCRYDRRQLYVRGPSPGITVVIRSAPRERVDVERKGG
ncbi:DUF2919 family protein [Salmonella enterica]|nr:DUF2919 domain-containing protein [Salmonella enterica]EEK8144562.1 DUF2919 domain-containing protein [Salmonella enterica]EJI9978175.1 DUF2919 family protein [Salmonella enterica]EJI9986444.1 DUF2919 family protein [Salmonella enterica]EJJ0001801.1 DUF2919 family protein [Salmonella enterica]